MLNGFLWILKVKVSCSVVSSSAAMAAVATKMAFQTAAMPFVSLSNKCISLWGILSVWLMISIISIDMKSKPNI